MSLITVMNAHLSWGDLPLLDEASMSVEEGERIGLIGRNGSGKSSLLSCLAGLTRLDDGVVQKQENLFVYYVDQEPVFHEELSIRESLVKKAEDFEQFHDERIYWRFLAKLDEYISKFGLDPERRAESCSGGEKKRAALSLAMALEPDLLLLDEPTNHLDIEAISILEEYLKATYKNQKSLVVITHDRFFLDSVSTRIIELDRGLLRSYEGRFSEYERRKAEEINAETLANRRFDKFWAQEEVWIRKGIEARRTRNEGRVRRLEALRRQRAARREQLGSMSLNIDARERSGKIVVETTGLGKSFEGKVVVKDLSLTLLRGSKVGLIGRNGAGKSTLIKLLLGKVAPDEGTIKMGTNISVAYFDQLRTQLNPDKTVAENIAPGSDWIEVNGQRKHVMSYLADFLFTPQRANSPVSSLSGGEKNRLLLARLFALPANLLVLDEPTNDLDIDSLEILEQTLSNYEGTLLIVSHDRAFLDNVVTEVLVPQGDGRWSLFAGGYSDWNEYHKAQLARQAEENKAKEKPSTKKESENQTRRRTQAVKLSFNEKKLLDSLPALIESLEAEQAALIEAMSLPDYHARGADELKKDSLRMKEIESLIEDSYAKWEVLEEKRLAAEKK